MMSTTVNLATERANIAYDAGKLAPSYLVSSIRDIGYIPKVEDYEIGVGGITSANCSD